MFHFLDEYIKNENTFSNRVGKFISMKNLSPELIHLICDKLFAKHDTASLGRLPTLSRDFKHIIYNTLSYQTSKIIIIEPVILNFPTNVLKYIKYYGKFYSVGDKFTFRSACVTGQLEVAQWLHKTFNFEIISNDVFEEVCKNGHLKVAQWMYSTFDLALENKFAFGFACMNGHLELAKWLHATTNLKSTVYDILCWVCDNGHLDIMQWLCETFGLTIDDVHCTLDSACANGHLELAKWLHVTFGLEKDAISSFRWACGNGYLEIAKWLHTAYVLKKADICSDNNLILRSACANGHIEVAKWLHKTFELTVKDTHRFVLRTTFC